MVELAYKNYNKGKRYKMEHVKFKEMRKKEREIGDQEIAEILEKGEYGVLATIGTNGYPYSVPLSYVYKNNSIYFHGATTGNKLENIESNNKVSFCVVGYTEILPEKFSTKYESVIIYGTAESVKGEEKERALEELIKKYSEEFIEKGKEYIKKAKDKTIVIKINIERVSGKARR